MIRAAALLTGLALLVAGCGGGDDDEPSATSSATLASASEPAPTSAASEPPATSEARGGDDGARDDGDRGDVRGRRDRRGAVRPRAACWSRWPTASTAP